jgi:hypothetical protein
MVAPLTIGGGIEVGGGVGIGTAFAAVAFTITSGDISNPQQYYSGYSSYTTAGFTSNGGTQIYNGIYYEITSGLYSTIAAAQAEAGLNSSNAWVWRASWTTGNSCLVRLGLVSSSPNYVVIAPINETDTRWQTGNDNSVTLAGSFAFPATFVPYVPYTAVNGNNSWC